MKVLVGFEESQIVTQAFIMYGHDAMSCDKYYPGDKGLPHYQGDIFDLLSEHWDLIILHPPCTYTCVSGNRWYHDSPLRVEGAELCLRAWDAAKKVSPRVALEQPKTIVQRWLGPKSQVVHPWQFGHAETKETWLWLHGLPLLRPTAILTHPEWFWHRVHRMPPGVDRSRMRSRTYPGIALAMAEQWGDGWSKL